MKKLPSSSSSKAALFVCGLFVLFNLFSSCNNFLKSGEVAQDIRDAIEYNNAPEYTILLKADDKQGRFLSANEKKIKVGYRVEVEFSANIDDFLFTGLEAVSKTDTTVRRDDCIKFTDIERDEKRGLYKIKITFLKAQNDIQIQPVCLEYPTVLDYTPKGSQTYPSNTRMTIQFNMAMEDSITEKVQFSIGDSDASEFIASSVLDSEKRVLTITPNQSKIKNYLIDEKKASVTIKVTLPDSITVTREKFDFPLKQNANTSFSITYITYTETVPPEIQTFLVTKIWKFTINLGSKSLSFS